MDWIKRNLYFVIFMVVGLVLMGASGWYLYSSWREDAAKLAEFNEQYATLKQLNEQKPNPGEDGPGKVDNVAAAKEQEAQLRKFSDSTHAYYERIKRIPDLPKVTDHDFATALSLTIAQMQRAASNANVSLANDQYGFSFEAERRRMVFDTKGLFPLSTQLGEVKTICDVLIDAKVNSLDGLRRERVSTDDTGAETDYLDQKSTTNALAVLSHYEVTFRGFSQELATVLSMFASSPYGLVVRSINVEPAPASEEAPPPETTATAPIQPQQRYIPQVRRNPQDEFNERYGMGGRRPPPTPMPQVQPVAVAPPPRTGALPIVLDEKKLKVTMLLDVVKLTTPNPK